MTAEESEMRDWVQLVQAEYLEMPGLTLTRTQFQRLWGLETKTCDVVLEQLLAAHVLRRTARDAYALDVASC